MSTFSLSDDVAAGALAASPRRDLARWLHTSGPGIAAALAWSAFGASCLWWPDLGDWSRTLALG
ncbi:hypothetical protein ABTH47_19770, partial [Acinetobacter baumannii]